MNTYTNTEGSIVFDLNHFSFLDPYCEALLILVTSIIFLSPSWRAKITEIAIKKLNHEPLRQILSRSFRMGKTVTKFRTKELAKTANDGGISVALCFGNLQSAEFPKIEKVFLSEFSIRERF